MIFWLLIILFFIAAGTAPVWPWSHDWGPYPLGGVSVVFLVLVILALCYPR